MRRAHCDTDPAMSSASGYGAQVDMTGRHRIAIVDDDHSVRKALQRLLRSINLDADAYGSGREFLAALSGAMPDCLVLDLQMPEMNGLELQQQLAESGVRLPVVVITGH